MSFQTLNLLVIDASSNLLPPAEKAKQKLQSTAQRLFLQLCSNSKTKVMSLASMINDTYIRNHTSQ